MTVSLVWATMGLRVLRRALPLLLGWLAGAFVAVEGGLGDELALADVARPEAQADVLDRRGQVALSGVALYQQATRKVQISPVSLYPCPGYAHCPGSELVLYSAIP